MPEISSKTRQNLVQISVGEEDPITLSFDANRISPRWIREAQARDEETDPDSLPKALADVIVSWNVTENGQPLDVMAGLSQLSFPALSELLTQVLKAAMPSSEEGNDSSEQLSSPPATSSEPVQTSPNGLAPSQLPQPSASQSPT